MANATLTAAVIEHIDAPLPPSEDFGQALENLLNSYSQENASGTPDFILAQYMIGCLHNYNTTVWARERWYNRTVNGTPYRIAENCVINNMNKPGMDSDIPF